MLRYTWFDSAGVCDMIGSFVEVSASSLERSILVESTPCRC